MDSQKQEDDILSPIDKEDKSSGTWIEDILDRLKDRVNRLQGDQLTFTCSLNPGNQVNLEILRRIVTIDYLAYTYSSRDNDTSSRIILFVNDHDTLDKIPQGWPLEEDSLGMRFDLLPKRYPKCKDTWNKILKGINSLKDTFNLSKLIFLSRFYSEGSMNEEIHNVLQHRFKINSHMRNELPEDEKYLPVYGYDENGYIVREGRYKSNHLIYKDETIDLLNGGGRFSEEIERASLWKLFHVDLEIQGRDTLDSLDNANWISNNIHDLESPLSITCGPITNREGKDLIDTKNNHPSIENILSLSPLWNLKHWILNQSIDSSLIYNEYGFKNNVNELIRQVDEYHRNKDEENFNSILPYVFRNEIPSWNGNKLNRYKVLRLLSCICNNYMGNLDSLIEHKGKLIREYLDMQFNTPYDEELLEFFYKDWIQLYSKKRSWTILHRNEIRELHKLLENLISNYKEEYIHNLIQGNTSMKKAFYKVTSMSNDGGFNLSDIVKLNGRSLTIDKINTAIKSTGCYVMPWRELGREPKN